MKKILPTILASLFLLIFLHSETFSKTTKVSYHETTKDKFVSHPTPPSESFNTYKNENYNLLIEYPKNGINYLNKKVGCGSFIHKEGEVIIDNLIRAHVLEWNKTLGEFLVSQGAQNLYNVSPILDSGATQALYLEGLKEQKTDEEIAPLTDISSLYLKDEKLFLISKDSQVLNEGCLKQDNSNWIVENHLRFY